MIAFAGHRARGWHAIVAHAALWLASACAHAQPAAGPPDADGYPTLKAGHTERECAVWAREQSFARAVERHDADAFAEHLHPGAIFNAGEVAAPRGREAVVKAWAGIVEGQTVVLRWRPGVVQIGGDPDVALSRGPYLLELPGAEPAKRWRVGEFQSIWVRDRDAWRVLYDMGATPPQPMETPEAARRFVAAHESLACER
ncbi:MAG TPA: nuclear transport factor 2 family protein [Caldimonas sp.]|nr:nuclear transport factor 2 family protein [Caldimonas sp.]